MVYLLLWGCVMIIVLPGDVPFSDPGPDPYRFEPVEDRMRVALRLIRESGGNEGSTAQWMQALAAWALEEPGKFPFPKKLA